jgi:HTH-type transcriptional regulator/antitoxin HigA
VSVSPIRTDADYRKARARLAKLWDKTDKASLDDIDMLALVMDDFERRNYPMEAPTPLAAIRFRMEQAGLKPRDLEPFIGSRSRVSEVLSGARPLSLDMIRALHRHLGIPAVALIQQDEPEPAAEPKEPSVPALQRLRSLGLMKAKETYAAFMKRMVGPQKAAAFLRKSRTQRTNAKTDQAALTAWLAAVRHLADQVDIAKPKKKQRGADAARSLAQLSTASDGPARARELLRKWGVVLVTLEHLPGTYLDGAAMCRDDGVDVIAMTLRHDRIDNFWFTLLHEFCHVSHHLSDTTPLILDDLELKSSDQIEDEADAFAQDALMPPELWSKSVSRNMDSEDINDLAAAANIHPAIVAGRWQREHNEYRRFSKMLGRGEVRIHLQSRT